MVISLGTLAKVMCIDMTTVNSDGSVKTEKNSDRLNLSIEQIERENAEILKAPEST